MLLEQARGADPIITSAITAHFRGRGLHGRIPLSPWADKPKISNGTCRGGNTGCVGQGFYAV